MGKPRIHPYISENVYAKLAAAAKKPDLSESQVVEAALAAFFSYDVDDARDAAIIRRLDRMTRQFGRIERDHMILGETLALFIRTYLTVTPPVPEQDKAAARAKGAERFEIFIEQLGRQLAAGKRAFENAFDEITPSAEEFFTAEDIAAMKESGAGRAKEAVDA